MSSTYLANKKVFVTGGTGTIGSQVVKELLADGAFVTVFSRDQNKQFKMTYDFCNPNLAFVNGDICDKELITRKMEGAEFVVHCAAAKHVPICEKNPDSASKVNIDGTRNVLESCLENGVKRFLLLSTDKSVYPTSVMGCTKFLAERLAIEFNRNFPCSVVRLGNVFGSNGSVVPTWLDRIKEGKPLRVNGKMCLRYFLTVKQAGRFIVDRLRDMEGGEIFIKKMKVLNIYDLAEAIKPEPNYPIEVCELTSGEKTKECLVTQDEASTAYDAGGFVIVNGKEKNACSHEVKFFTHEEIKDMLKECHA